MQIQDLTSQKGRTVEGFLQVAKLSNGTKLKIPLMISEGRNPGPTCFISAGIHGDEINGIELHHDFRNHFKDHNLIRDLAGTIIWLPILNPWGFDANMRGVPFDKKNLNRAFNETGRKTVTNRIADTLLSEIIKKCDFGFDLHDSGQRKVLLPHTRVHMEEKHTNTQELGRIFGTDMIMVRKAERGMLAQAAKKARIPVLTVEIGGALVIWGHFLERGILGILNVLRHHTMLPGKPVLPERQFFLKEREGTRAKFKGIFHVYYRLGEMVHKGDLLGELLDPVTGKVQRVKATRCAILFSRRMHSRVNRGDSLLDTLNFGKCPIHKIGAPDVRVLRNRPTHTHDVTSSDLLLANAEKDIE